MVGNFAKPKCECPVCAGPVPKAETGELVVRRVILGHVCPQCEKLYEPSRPSQVWCHPRCGHAFRRDRKKRCLVSQAPEPAELGSEEMRPH